MDLNNPFSSSKASDYTDEQINSFWTEMDPEFYNTPRKLDQKIVANKIE